MIDYIHFDAYVIGFLICSVAAGDKNKEIDERKGEEARGTHFLSFVSDVKKLGFEKTFLNSAGRKGSIILL